MIPPVLTSSKSVEWETPHDFFQKLHREFHFTLDPCATTKNAKCRMYFTKAKDGLAQDWSGKRVFMNPPYGKEINRWMKKARQEAMWGGALVVALVPCMTKTRWWHDHVERRASEIRFIRGSIRFKKGRFVGRAPFSSVVIVYRPFHFNSSSRSPGSTRQGWR